MALYLNKREFFNGALALYQPNNEFYDGMHPRGSCVNKLFIDSNE
jgi:hypothetical protein